MSPPFTRKKYCNNITKKMCLDTKHIKLTYPQHIIRGIDKIPLGWKYTLLPTKKMTYKNSNLINMNQSVLNKCIGKIYETIKNIDFSIVTINTYQLYHRSQHQQTSPTDQYTSSTDQYNIPEYSKIFHQLLMKSEPLVSKSVLDTKKTLLNNNSLFNKCIHQLRNSSYSSYPNHTSLKFHDLLVSIYSSPEALFTIESQMTTMIKIAFKYTLLGSSHTYTNLFIYLDYKDLNKYNTPSFLNKVINRILFINYYLDTHKLPDKIVIYLTNLKKKFPKLKMSEVSNTKMRNNYTASNVNSAITDSYDIVMYRREELLKSILHELVHFHKIDGRHYPNHLIQQLVTRHQISPENKYHIGEAMTEVLANLFNVGFIVQEKYNTKNNLTLFSYIKHYKTHTLYEMIHNGIQVSKIVKYLGYSRFQDFCKLNQSVDNKPLLKHATCVFSYYVLKMYLLHQIINFVKHFHTDHYCLMVKNNTQHYQCLDNLFEKSRLDSTLHRFINYFIKNGPKDNQLRMTAHLL